VVLFLGGSEVWTQDFTWAMPPVLFCFSYFSGSVSSIFLQLASDLDPPTYSLPCSLDQKHASPHPVYWLRWGLTNFLPRLTLNCDPSDLHLLSSWFYRCRPPSLAWNNFFLNPLTEEETGTHRGQVSCSRAYRVVYCKTTIQILVVRLDSCY
jgi:hypothetical protein